MKKTALMLIFVVGGALLGNPLALATSNSDLRTAESEARFDAKLDVNNRLWFALGCLVPFWGNIGAILYEPSVPAMPLIGKSPEYVTVYTDVYLRESKRIRSKHAMGGCLTNIAVSTISITALVIFAESSATR